MKLDKLLKFKYSFHTLRSRLAQLLFPPRPSHRTSIGPLQETTDGASTQIGLQGEALTLASELKGKTLRIPDLWEVFSGWPVATNKHLDRLQTLVDATLDAVITDEKRLCGLKRANFARLIALWYPDADWSELEVATAYSVWIFVWDDEVDAGDTDVSVDEELALAYSQQSRDFIGKKLGLTLDGEGNPRQDNFDTSSPEEAPHPNMVLFSEVGRAMCAGTDLVQRQRFYDELKNFMVQVAIEHTHRLKGSIPTLEKYIEIRSGSVGCAPQIAITDYMPKVRLPEPIMESAAMKAIWNETVLICLILNDIYSVQKEIAQGSLFNIVPVMFKNQKDENRTLGVVTNKLMVLLKESMNKFESAAISLSEMMTSDAKLNNDTEVFIKWCRYFITGVLAWSLDSRRYGMAKCLQDDGSVSIIL